MNARARVPLGGTDVTVTRLGVGTAPLGGLYQPVSDADAQAALGVAWNAGIRFFDTAPLYGNGLAEERLGRFLRDKPRDTFTIATKVGRLLRHGVPPEAGQVFEGAPPLHPVFDFSYEGVMRSIEESLARLGLDSVDILHIHDPDDYFDDALDGAYRALDELRRDGTVRAVGAGMNQWQMLGRFARAADFDCFLLAGRYTLLDPSALDAFLPLCERKGIAVIAGGVYNSGVLADPRPGSHYNYQKAPPDVIARAQRLGALCAKHSVPLKAAAMQFPLGHPAVTTVLTGVRSAEEMRENLAMFETPIPLSLWDDMKQEHLLPQNAPVP